MGLLLPNIRRLFVPDPGYVLLDCDLAGADAQVVAWEANDEDLKEAFRKGLKVHHKNAADMWGEAYTSLAADDPRKAKRYYEIKRAVHGTNYLSTPKNIAAILNWTVGEATDFQRKWFSLHPGIKAWHNRIRESLERSRSVTNAYGFTRTYFDRVDSILPEAVAWNPQSTVAITCFKGALSLRENLPWVEILIQVHDSLVMQIPLSRIGDVLLVRRHLLNTIPYPDPLVIQWGLSLSPTSWGDVKELKWEEAADLKL